MTKILKYELKRLLINKFFFTLLVITLLYAYQILRGDILAGIAYTAPFSGWSYGAYIANTLPLMLITLLFFITFMYSRQEKQVRLLTAATPVDPVRYGLVKCAAMAVGFFIIALCVVAMSLVFYAVILKFYGFASFIIPLLAALIPAFLFMLGLGLLAGGVQPNILYVLMLAALLVSLLPLPAFFDLCGKQLFSNYPLTLPAGPDGEPAFSLPRAFVAGRICYGAVGLLMIFLGIKSYAKQSGLGAGSSRG